VKISVIVPVRDDPRLGICLRALADQTLERDRFEVVVVDNGSTQPVRPLAERFGARAVSEPAGGSYAARAAGVGTAAGELLVFTDADCRPPPDWLATIERAFADPTCQVVIGPSREARHSTVSAWAQRIDGARWAELARREQIAFCDTRNLALRREVIEAVPFDPAFRQAGDLDLGIRLHRAGYAIRMDPAAWVAHDNPHSLRVIVRRGIRRGRGLAQLLRKHGPITGPIGSRALRVAGVDLKRPILAAARVPLLRRPAIVLVSGMLVPLIGVLWVLARAPGGEALGAGPFLAFERLTLLLGRLQG
jgi:cellulose synthase/poly-beta-1,6-N-acetylglucosamine synthase-like glycosyltransferase